MEALISTFTFLTGHATLVKSLLASGADVKIIDTAGWNVLHWSAFHGFEQIVEILIEHGADVNAENVHSATALHTATYNGLNSANFRFFSNFHTIRCITH